MNINSSATNSIRVTATSIATPRRSSSINVSSIMQSAETLATSLSLKSIRTERKLLKAIKKNDALYLNQKLKKHPELAEKLISRRGFVGKFTPLSLACQYAQLDAMSELIQSGVDINQTDTEGASALMFAVKSGSFDAVNLLLAKNPDINQVDNKGFSSLMVAMKSDSLDIVKLLLEHKAYLYQKNIRGIYCSTIAVAHGKLEIVKELIKHGLNIFNEIDEHNNLLMVACKHGHLDIARFLKAIGMEINQQATQTKTTALHFAVKHGHAEVVEFLLEAGANPNLTDICGLNPLYFAKANKDDKIIQILTTRGAEDNGEQMNNGSLLEGNLPRFLNRNTPSYRSFT